MSFRSKPLSTIVSLLLVFALTQVCIAVSLAGPKSSTTGHESSPVPLRPTIAALATQGNKPISVNGEPAISGTTIVSGASIETPNGVGASVSIGSLGFLTIQPNTKLTLEFQPGGVKVTVPEGCVTLHTRAGTTGEVESLKNGTGKTDPAKDDVVASCSGSPIPEPAPAPANNQDFFGLGKAATIALVGGIETAVILIIVLNGDNPSPSSP